MTDTPKRPGTRRRKLFTALGAILSATVLVYLFRSVSLKEVAALVLRASLPGLVAFVALSLGTSFLRMWRYRLILHANGYRPSALALYLVVLVRNFCADLLPARLGSLVYVFLVTTRLEVPISPATSSFALAFLFDILAIVPLMLLALATDPAVISSPLGIDLPGFLLWALILAAVTLGLWAALPGFVEWTAKTIGQLHLLPALRPKAVQLLGELARDLAQAREFGLSWRLFFLSFLVRLGKYASLYLLLYALLAPQGYTYSDLPPGRVFWGLCAAELSASLPISGIAGLGAYQGAWVLTFQLLGFDPHISKLTSLSHHLFTQFYGYTLGLTALLVLLLPCFARQKPGLK